LGQLLMSTMFNSSMKMFEDDPFFNGLRQPQMPSIMPFEHRRRQGDRRDVGQEVDSFRDPFQSMMENMSKMMGGLHTHMRGMENNSDSHCYTSSMVMSYQNDGKSQPKFMQASTSTRRAPGDVKETRRTYRDSESGVEKMAIGHHIGGRGHEIEKRRQRGGSIEEERRFYELNEDELPGFENEWRKQTKSYSLPAQRSNRLRGEKPERQERNAEIEYRPSGPSKSGRRRY